MPFVDPDQTFNVPNVTFKDPDQFVDPDQPQSLLGNALYPLKRTAQLMPQLASEYGQQFKEAFTKPSWTSPVRALMAAGGYLNTPLQAAIRGIVAEPIERNTGIPAPATELATALALPLLGKSQLVQQAVPQAVKNVVGIPSPVPYTPFKTPPPKNPLAGFEPRLTPEELLKPIPEPVPKYAGSSNLGRFANPDDVVDSVYNLFKAYEPEINTARRGKISHEQARAMADATGFGINDMLKLKPGSILPAEYIPAMRDTLDASLVSLKQTAQQALTGDPVALAKFAEQQTLHAALLSKVQGMATEAGRLLEIHKMLATNQSQAAVRGVLQAGGNDMMKLAQQVVGATTPGQANSAIQALNKSSFLDKFSEAAVSGMVSGFKTHATNILSNAIVSATQLPERAIGGLIGKLHVGDKVYLREVGAQAAGMVHGAIEGLQTIGNEIKSGGLLNYGQQGKYEFAPKIGGKLGQYIRTPFAALGIEDDFFKAIASRMEINAQAMRQAIQEGAPNPAERMFEIANAPSAKLAEIGKQAALEQTFQKPLGEIGQAVLKFSQAHPLTKLIVPFVRTPTNIFKYAMARTPIAPFTTEFREAFNQGGAARDMALARVAFGTGVGLTTVMLANQGLITGEGPANKNLKNTMLNAGWQPYSIKVGDKYYQYNRLAPLGQLLGVSADLSEINDYIQSDKERKDLASMVAMSIAKNITNQTFLQGLTGVVHLLDDPNRYGETEINQFAGLLVPNIVAQTVPETDPLMRQANNSLEKIKSRIPGASQGLLPKLDIFGKPIERQKSFGPDIISPIGMSQETTDPLRKEMARLKMSVSMPQKQIMSVRLEPPEYNKFVERGGNTAEQILQQVVTSDSYKALPDFAKERVIREVLHRARTAASQTMLPEFSQERLRTGLIKQYRLPVSEE